jgi:hypothetical protein
MPFSKNLLHLGRWWANNKELGLYEMAGEVRKMKNYDLLVAPKQKVDEQVNYSPSDKYSFPHEKMVKYQFYENAVEQISKIVENIAKQAKHDKLSEYDVEFIINDTMSRVQDAIGYTISTLEALKQDDPHSTR